MEVKNINPYLVNSNSSYVTKRLKPISLLDTMLYGNKPADGGNLILEMNEKNEMVKSFHESQKFIKKIVFFIKVGLLFVCPLLQFFDHGSHFQVLTRHLNIKNHVIAFFCTGKSHQFESP